MIRPVIPARKVSEGRWSDRGAFYRMSRFETAPQFPKTPLRLGQWRIFFFRERQTVTIWRQWDKMTTGRGEGLMRYSDSWVHLDLILQVIQHIMSSNQIHEENEEQIKKKELGEEKKMREKSCGKRAWARLRHSSGHSHETDHSDETSPPCPSFQFSPLLFLLFFFFLFLRDCSTSLLLPSSLCLANMAAVNLVHTP